jgi:hypothetical protein
MANVYSNANGPNTAASSVSLNDTRRIFNFGDRVAELAPQQSPFFVYLSKVAKKATNDPVFKFLEQRHQWQRRNFTVETTMTGTGGDVHEAILSDAASPSSFSAMGNNLELDLHCGYNEYGIVESGQPCTFIKPGAVLAIVDNGGTVRRMKLHDDVTITHSASKTTISLYTHTGTTWHATAMGDWAASNIFTAGAQGQVIGSAFGEGTDSPDGWEDKLYDREGYCQIFKTGMSIFSGTAMATEYRGLANEYQRVWQDKLMEHKMDIEQAMLFSVGASSAEALATVPNRATWGIVPYTESYGKVYNMSYASSGYDAFLDAMEDYFAPESGNSGEKLVLASRKVITYLNKLGAGSFLNNSVGSSQYRLDVDTVPGSFGHTVTVVNTIFGNLHFVQEPLLRGPWEDYCVAIDLKNVAYRPLVGNGVSRDTFIETNVQNPGVDGRTDQIITEAGLEISLPETHAILKFS